MDIGQLLKVVPKWAVLFLLALLVGVILERLYISKSPIYLFNQKFGPEVEENINALPIGSIVAWSPKYGDSDSLVNGIPKGWKICNGKDGTPNLENRFLLGATISRSDSQGGARDIVEINGEPKYIIGSAETRMATVEGAADRQVIGSIEKLLTPYPPYYSVVYIVKVK